MTHKYKIVFMGTPPFSVPGLQALYQNGHEIALVVTQPDRPKGRGRRMTPSPVKQTALELGYQVIQPPSVKTADFVDQIKSLKPDFQVVIAYGKILPEKVLVLPRIGTINIHASLLPKLRGAAPIQWAVINGDTETGVCSMLMDKGMDTGDVLLSVKEAIDPADTAGTLHDRLAVAGAQVLIDTLSAYSENTIQPIPQNHNLATYAPLLTKDDGLINWNKSAKALDNFIRGVNPWPGAYTFWEDKRLKIFRSTPVSADISEPPGTVLAGFPDELRVAAGDGLLSILEIQGASGKRLATKEFLRGHPIPPGTILG
ncbi:methionyl-tRNA formyltransferase [Alkalispirochaeta odontotermitis]|nr:methionyl-tRNA formyltransferase [Alkalispirochaeta odontotermitis]CAB1081263.1 Methionyl-tRNA formyltransferase (EC [Olavius algarvensis Delta 1 endosymbiont]